MEGRSNRISNRENEEVFMIFFDLDGTLLDHDSAVKKALIRMIKVKSIDWGYGEEEVYKVWSENLEKYYELYLKGKLSHSEQRVERMKAFYKKFDVDLSDEEVEESFNTYLEAYENNWRLYEDVIECLSNLRSSQLGIISNGYFPQQTDKLKNTGIFDLFKVIVTSNELGIAKPKREIFLHACEKAQVNVQDCIYIGDRWDADAIGSSEAGMKAIWLDRAGTYNGSKDNIEVINTLKELSPLLCKLKISNI
ncbi:HAD family hydrolase [Clostridium sp. D2Q-11]|uniref:HAD family hydrolase n=1 Tax=Anaeromonas frigoriresistens TaxID=2683708 RepID=A0A942UXT0_9FIRM|nr:HAD family hydrolase [Anaeromonas frigoriresistens]MBS4538774.1 HAD family hydrolase [Anaeromonas frigoriresistens]